MITRKTKKLVYNIVVIALLVIGMAYVCSRFIHLGNVEYTDNAQVKQHITPVNTRVQGFIKKIYFDEYKPIHKGDTLLVIEDAEFRLRLAQAEADLANALAGQQVTSAGIATTQNNLTVNDASIEEVRVQRANAERELQRYKKLLEEDAVTRQQYDNIKTAYDAINAQYERVLRIKHSTSLTKEEQTHQLGQNEAAIRLAQAAVDLARLNLSYTVIVATCDGVTGRKDIHEGQLVQRVYLVGVQKPVVPGEGAAGHVFLVGVVGGEQPQAPVRGEVVASCERGSPSAEIGGDVVVNRAVQLPIDVEERAEVRRAFVQGAAAVVHGYLFPGRLRGLFLGLPARGQEQPDGHEGDGLSMICFHFGCPFLF